jgi:hypothetical protein
MINYWACLITTRDDDKNLIQWKYRACLITTELHKQFQHPRSEQQDGGSTYFVLMFIASNLCIAPQTISFSTDHLTTKHNEERPQPRPQREGGGWTVMTAVPRTGRKIRAAAAARNGGCDKERWLQQFMETAAAATNGGSCEYGKRRRIAGWNGSQGNDARG